MILRTNYDGDLEPTDVTGDPAETEIAAAVRSMDWNRFAFVTLFKDDDNWLEGSGCLEPGFGLSMMLSVDRIQYVTATAPPTPDAMLGLFNAYLKGDDDLLFGLIYDAKRRGLNADDVSTLRQQDETPQRERMMSAALAESADLFLKKDYGAFIAALSPYESLLGPMDAKKLAIARRKHGD